MNLHQILSENDTVLHHGVEVPAQVASGTEGRDMPVVERLEVAIFDATGYCGSLFIYDIDSTTAQKLRENGISRPA